MGEGDTTMRTVYVSERSYYNKTGDPIECAFHGFYVLRSCETDSIAALVEDSSGKVWTETIGNITFKEPFLKFKRLPTSTTL